MSTEIGYFVWRGSTWPDGSGTGPGFTGGYWNYSANWYERVDGFTSGYGQSGGNSGPGYDGYWYKTANRFPRGNDVATLKKLTAYEAPGIIKNGPEVTLSHGGYTNGSWMGATGEDDSGASGNGVILSIKSNYPFDYIGSDGVTYGGGSFGVGSNQRLMIKGVEVNTLWRGNKDLKLYNSDIDTFKHKGTAISHLNNSTIRNYLLEVDSDCATWQGYSLLDGCTIDYSYQAEGTVCPYVSLNNCTGSTGSNFDSIRYVSFMSNSFLHNKVSISANIDSLNFSPAGSSAGNVQNTIILNSPAGNTFSGNNRIHIRNIDQGWSPDFPWASGNTYNSIIELRCGATIDNYNLQSGTFQIAEDVGNQDNICITDGQINQKGLVRGYHPSNTTYQGFRIGADRGNTQEGFLILNKGAHFDFNPGMYVLADYAYGTTGGDEGLGGGPGLGGGGK